MTTKKLDDFLESCDEKDYRILQIRLQIAESLRNIEKRYKLSNVQMAKELYISIDLYKKWRNGAIDFDIGAIARINCLDDHLYAENNDMVIIKEDK